MDVAALVDRLPEMVVVIGSDLRIAFVNRRLLEVMGYEREAVLGSNIFDYVHPDDHEYMMSTWATRASKPGETGIIIEARGRNADGSWRAVEILGLSLLDDGVIDGMVMTLRDLRHKADKGAPARLRSMVDRTTDVVLLLDGEARIGYANRRLTSRYRLDQDEVVGHPFATTLLPPDDRAAFDTWFAALVAAGDRADAGIRLRVATVATGGSLPTVEWHGTNQLDDPLIAGVILSGRDVTDLVEMEGRLAAQTDQLRHTADHDALTGLLNRRAFVGAVGEVLAERRALGDDGDVVVLFCDLDRFKQVNDTYGHAVGDEVLRVAAERLRGCLREDDLVARWGGDEFTVLLDGSPPDDVVAELVERLGVLFRTPIRGGEVTAAVGVTVGISRAAVATAEVDALLRHADEAMYANKPPR